MANLGKIIKDEIVRLSKKNARLLANPLKAEVRSLKQELKCLEAELKSFQTLLKKYAQTQNAPAAEEPAEGARTWFTSKGIRSLRRKLALTQAELATLAGVSAQAVVSWEKKGAKLRLRETTLPALKTIRTLGRKGVRAELAQKKPAPAKP